MKPWLYNWQGGDINYIKNGFSKLNLTLIYINFDVIYAIKVFLGLTPGQFYKANFGINYIKNGFKLNFTLNYINFDVINAKWVYRIDPRD